MSRRDAAAHGCLENPQARRQIEGNVANSSTSKPALQWVRGLRELTKGPRNTRQLAGPPVHAHAAHSLAAEIRKKGVTLIARTIEVRGYADSTVRIAEYEIHPDSRELAERLVAEQR